MRHKCQVRDETETLTDFVEMRPRHDFDMSRNCLETETLRPRPQPRAVQCE